jgi:large subunit ribosomal protein L3
MKIFATKKGTVQYYDDSGRHKVATVLELKKTIVAKSEKIGDETLTHYALVTKKQLAKKPVVGQYKAAGSFSKIVTSKGATDTKVSQGVGVEAISENDQVTVFARTKGKGFAGTIKRHGFHRGPKSHGSRNYRRPGSIGDTGPQRVVKGKKMAGHMGYENKTLKDIPVVRVIKDESRLWLRGHIPGPKGSLLVIERKND